MARRMSRIAIAGAALGVGALSATIAIPAVAETVSGEATPSEAVTKRVESIRDALQGLVDDKTLTDAQADRVADTLADSDALRGGHGGKFLGGGMGMDAAASALGMSAEDVRSALMDGTTIAQLAERQGKNVDDVVAAMVKGATTRLDEAVEAGRITQAQADEMKGSLEERIRDFVQNGKPAGGRGWGMHRGPGGGPGEKTPGEDSPSTPSPSATTQSSSFRI
jgi:hypothetical protein